ncbi:MAG: beta-lactamase family protein [Muribaculaceae bacterium]|nr:beta-lactamase family protein [Muribaculaceae bacterium]
MKHLVSVCAIVCALLGIMGACTTSKSESEPTLEQKLDSVFSAVFPADAPGAAVLIMQGDSVVFEHCYGLADMEKKTPVTPTTNFCIASLSKQFSAMAILQLAEQGKLSLDDPFTKFFPQWRTPVLRKITLRHLLTHTSGIPDNRNRIDTAFMLYANDIESPSYIGSLTGLYFEPGSEYDYQNPTYQLIYQIVPKVTGEDFENYMREHIFKPAGMEHTMYFEKDRDIPEMAHGYKKEYNTPYEEFDYGEEKFFGTKADGALYTSVREFLLWERALASGKIVSDSTLRLAYTPAIDVRRRSSYGYEMDYTTSYGMGFFIKQRPGWPTIISHTGDNGGFTTYAAKIPDRGITIQFFSTRNNINRETIVNAVLELLLGKPEQTPDSIK